MQPAGSGQGTPPVTTQASGHGYSVTIAPAQTSGSYSIAGSPGVISIAGQKRPAESQSLSVKARKTEVAKDTIGAGQVVRTVIVTPIAPWQPGVVSPYSLSQLQAGSSGLSASMSLPKGLFESSIAPFDPSSQLLKGSSPGSSRKKGKRLSLAERCQNWARGITAEGLDTNAQRVWEVSESTPAIALDELLKEKPGVHLNDDQRTKIFDVLAKARAGLKVPRSKGPVPDFTTLEPETSKPVAPPESEKTVVVSKPVGIVRPLPPETEPATLSAEDKGESEDKSSPEVSMAMQLELPGTINRMESDASGQSRDTDELSGSVTPSESTSGSISSEVTSVSSTSSAEKLRLAGTVSEPVVVQIPELEGIAFAGLPNNHKNCCYMNASVQFLRETLTRQERDDLLSIWKQKQDKNPRDIPGSLVEAFSALLMHMEYSTPKEIEKAQQAFVWHCWKDPQVKSAIDIKLKRGGGLPEDPRSLMKCLAQHDSDEFLKCLKEALAGVLPGRSVFYSRSVLDTEFAGTLFSKSEENSIAQPQLVVNLVDSGSIQESIDSLSRKELMTGDNKPKWSRSDTNIKSSRSGADLPSAKYDSWKYFALEADILHLHRITIRLVGEVKVRRGSRKRECWKKTLNHIFEPVAFNKVHSSSASNPGEFRLQAEPFCMICHHGDNLATGHYVTLVSHEGHWILLEDKEAAKVLPDPAAVLKRRKLLPVIVEYRVTEKPQQ